MLPDSKPICSSGLHDSFSTEIPSEGEFPWISSEKEQLIIAVLSIVVLYISCDARIHDTYIILTYKSFKNHCR